ncbi:pentatricopeptide repeat-containing protein At3g12770-like [Prunus dulcis]|uniref:pentatricopeptide repeat-containing protein At3g12770-like n=1 Tax=Prunus dulcis TaxID=3755 RepID=UPI0014839427|nr:pentatricopeptide repeat-containing protein At3g12770-like [Prunus dulcis]
MTNKFIPSFKVSLLGTNQPFYNLITHYLYVSNTLNQLKQIHTLLLKSPTKPNHRYHILVQLLKRLLQLPGDNLRYAHYLFDQIPKCRNQFLWTSLIHSHVLHDHFGQSITLYAKMHWVGVSPSGFTFSSVLNACARVPALFEGKQVHARVVQYGFLGNKIVQTALLHMYAKCGLVLDARDIFDRMDDKDLVAWTAMVCGYSKMGLMGEARWLFDNMEQRNAVSWTTMVAGYANNGDMETAKELYERMVEKDSVRLPDHIVRSWTRGFRVDLFGTLTLFDSQDTAKLVQVEGKLFWA